MDLTELRKLAEGATPGPWSYHCRDREGRDSWFLGWHVDGPPEAERGQFERGADAAFIAAARTAVPELLDRLEAAEAALAAAQEREERVREALETYGDHYHMCPAYDTAHMDAAFQAAHPCDCGLDAALAPEEEVEHGSD